ncbi:MAG: hypothetical protein KDJ41_01750 [Hyphomicrobiaceae bacterium]|nr:hypothetical protein [Hyphomicrobiaceae bacterium]
MSKPGRQLTLDLPHRAALDAEDFLVSDSNAAAVAVIDRWPDWSAGGLMLVGPAGVGKSHLANVWRRRSGAVLISAAALTDQSLRHVLTASAVIVEDVDRGLGEERALFHLLNLGREQRLSLLLTSRANPGIMEIALADLRSRLRAMPVVEIEAPDEALMQAVVVKLFADRQLAVEPSVVAYVAAAAGRSMEAAVRTVAEIDQVALASRRRVTQTLASEVLSGMTSEAGDA